MAFIKYTTERSLPTVEGMTCNRDEGSQQRCPLIARHAAGLLAFITIDLSVRVSRFAFVICGAGLHLHAHAVGKKEAASLREKRAFITNRPTERGITDGESARSMPQKINRHCSRPTLLELASLCLLYTLHATIVNGERGALPRTFSNGTS